MNIDSSKHSHFAGKDVVEHLREARAKGANASMEVHGLELPGHIAAGCDALRDTLIVLVLLSIIFPLSFTSIIAFSVGWMIWKVARSARLGWARLERLHRLIEEERWEIEHHRAQEKEELRALYEVKGLKGKLLDDVIEVLMADDNRLLQIMLEEELGLQLESYEHPLRQALGACVGCVVASLAFLGAFYSQIAYAPLATGLVLILATSIWSAKLEKNRAITAATWILAAVVFAFGIAYFINQLLQ